MLQQTRVATVIPYYHRFLARFSTPGELASAQEPELLTMWAGLGYYSRARNLQKAARDISALKTFPATYDLIRALPGVGDYTAAAVASIAFGLPYAAVDGNVKRVMARLTNQGVAGAEEADRFLDRENPGRWNQAVMELGATICLPREPLCDACPIHAFCQAKQLGNQRNVPLKRTKPAQENLQRTVFIVRRNEKLLLVPSLRVAGFWDLPEVAIGLRNGAKLGEFTHTITHRRYRFTVKEARLGKIPKAARWYAESLLPSIPLSTVAKKALRVSERARQQ